MDEHELLIVVFIQRFLEARCLEVLLFVEQKARGIAKPGVLRVEKTDEFETIKDKYKRGVWLFSS